MSPSQLREFNRRSIDHLIEEGIHMVYDHHLMEENENWGIWEPSYDLIRINPNVEKKGRNFADLVIVHEWLHPFEDLVLERSKRFKETQIDWWAAYHLQRDPKIGDYIRSFFLEYGFK